MMYTNESFSLAEWVWNFGLARVLKSFIATFVS